MNSEVREQVRQALLVEWPAFAERHPNLAAAMDETMLVEPAIAALREDPEYAQAMRTADEIGAGAGVVAEIVVGFVREWLGRMV